MSWRTRLTVCVHPRARTEHLERDGSTLQLRSASRQPMGGQTRP